MSVSNKNELLRHRLSDLSRAWRQNGLPDRAVLTQTADQLHQWKIDNGCNGLWPNNPLMLTGTLDDGSGLGLHLIESYGQLAGLHIHRLGLMLKPDTLLAACRQEHPDLLGLTVLQVDSHTELALIGQGLPPSTLLIAGGPAFRYDPEMAEACGVTFMARNVAYFIDFLLKWVPNSSHSDMKIA